MVAPFRHAKFRAPLARARDQLSSVWRKMFAMLGRYQPLALNPLIPDDTAPVIYRGDIPITAGDECRQRRLVFSDPPPIVDMVENLTVTPAGAGWVNGCLFERYSASRPGLRMLMAPHAPVREIETGYFVQSEHTDTFGDWISEYLSPLSRAGVLDAPIFLPRAMARKSYVQRDAARLKLDIVEIDAPVRIAKARVVRQQRHMRFWSAGEITALGAFLGVEPRTPAPGSMLYLSRYGETSEVADRTHPNLFIEEFVKKQGCRVLRTAQMTLEDYIEAAASAETVLLDHGSAGYNMIYWRPRRVVEFVSDTWWNNSFLIFANAMGVRDYTIIRTDCGDDAEIGAKIDAVLKTPCEENA